MTTFIYAKFSAAELKFINQCRLFHQVLTVADIATADGLTIDPRYFLHEINASRVSTLRWPVQNIPSRRAWLVWNQALGLLQERGKLKQPVGQWARSPYQLWRWRICPTSFTLYHLRPEGRWEYYSPPPHGNTGTLADKRQRYFLSRGRESEPPTGRIVYASPLFNQEDGDLVTVAWSKDFGISEARAEVEQPRAQLPDHEETEEQVETPTMRFSSLFEQTAPFFHRLIGPLEMPTDELLSILSEHIASHSLLACSDGSFSKSERIGSHAWVAYFVITSKHYRAALCEDSECKQ